VQAYLDGCIGLFGGAHEGDTTHPDQVPGRASGVVIDATGIGVNDRHDFNAALSGVCLGESPETESLKKAMVGVDKQ